MQVMQRLELECFGCRRDDYGKEIKGVTLIERKRFAVVREGTTFPDTAEGGLSVDPHWITALIRLFLEFRSLTNAH